MELFIKTAKSSDTTIIMVMHEPIIVVYADREITVRDGKIANLMNLAAYSTPIDAANTEKSGARK